MLTVSAVHPRTDERDHEALAELGDTTAHTINARGTTTRRTDSVVGLEGQFHEADTPLGRFTRECTAEFQGFVPRSDGEADVFFTANGGSRTDFQAAAEQSLAFVETERLTEEAGDALFRARISEPTLAARGADEDAGPRSITVDASDATATLDLSHTAGVCQLLDRLRQWHPGVGRCARQPRERSVGTRRTFVAAVEDRLTERQRASADGLLERYFQYSVCEHGRELTDLLGVSQPTFSGHLRGAERALCELLFGNVSLGASVG